MATEFELRNHLIVARETTKATPTIKTACGRIGYADLDRDGEERVAFEYDTSGGQRFEAYPSKLWRKVTCTACLEWITKNPDKVG